MNRPLLSAALLALSAAGCAPASAEPGAPAEVDLGAQLKAGGCDLCHASASVEPAPREASCSSCHTWIRAIAASPAARAQALEIFPHWERYERNVASYLQVPSLDAAAARLDPEWLRGWLADPHDVRPHLSEGMPRLGLDDDALDALVAGLGGLQFDAPARPATDAANLARGEALFAERGCGGCHAVGARGGGGWPMAPDLAHASARMDPDVAAAWLLDPSAVSPAATMPPTDLTEDEALAIRDWLWLADHDAPPMPAAAEMPDPVERPVRWEEVNERVFAKICAHCHMDPTQNEGRAGPGNAGGFGWPATGIELQTLAGVRAVADRIPDALARRRAEAARDSVAPGHAPAALERPARPGMPLGLPPLSDEDTALVLGWLAQGAPE